MSQLLRDAAPACKGASKAAHQHPVHYSPEALPQRCIAPRAQAPCFESHATALPVQSSDCSVLQPPQACTAELSKWFTVVRHCVCHTERHLQCFALMVRCLKASRSGEFQISCMSLIDKKVIGHLSCVGHHDAKQQSFLFGVSAI